MSIEYFRQKESSYPDRLFLNMDPDLDPDPLLKYVHNIWSGSILVNQ